MLRISHLKIKSWVSLSVTAPCVGLSSNPEQTTHIHQTTYINHALLIKFWHFDYVRVLYGALCALHIAEIES